MEFWKSTEQMEPNQSSWLLWSSANPSLLLEVSRRQGWAPGCSSSAGLVFIFEVISPFFPLLMQHQAEFPSSCAPCPEWEQL